MFSGQGSQYHQMGRHLYESHPVFRDWMTRLDGVAHRLTGRSVVDAIYSGSKAEPFARTALTHPAIFMVEYALAQCLQHEGIQPDLTLGASLGSFAAAAVAGCIEPQGALVAVLEQAAAFESTCEPGGMIAVLGDPALYPQDFLCQHSELAGISFAQHFTVSAPRHELGGIEAALKQRGVAHQRLEVSYAYHSRWIAGAQPRIATSMQVLPRWPGRLPVVCCAQAATLAELPLDFFWRVVRQPIQLRDTIAHLERPGRPLRYIDVGPSGTLATFVKYALGPGSRSSTHAVLTPYGQDGRNLASLVAAQAEPALP